MLLFIWSLLYKYCNLLSIYAFFTLIKGKFLAAFLRLLLIIWESLKYFFKMMKLVLSKIVLIDFRFISLQRVAILDNLIYHYMEWSAHIQVVKHTLLAKLDIKHKGTLLPIVSTPNGLCLLLDVLVRYFFT